MFKRLSNKAAYSILKNIVKIKMKAHSCDIFKQHATFNSGTSIGIDVEYEDGKGCMSTLMYKDRYDSIRSYQFIVQSKDASWSKILRIIEHMSSAGKSFYVGVPSNQFLHQRNLIFDANQTIEEALISIDLSI